MRRRCLLNAFFQTSFSYKHCADQSPLVVGVDWIDRLPVYSGLFSQRIRICYREFAVTVFEIKELSFLSTAAATAATPGSTFHRCYLTGPIMRKAGD